MTTGNPTSSSRSHHRRLPQIASLSRRRFLGGGAALGAGLLTGCAANGSVQSETDRSAHPLVIRTWADYIDPDDDAYLGTVARFARDYGVPVDYIEEYEDNAAELAETFAPLGAGRTIGPDIVVPTNWVASRLVTRGWVEPIQIENVPNHANVDPAFLTPTWDRGALYNMPWQVGITGIAYNPDITGPISSLAQIFDGDDSFGVGFIPEMREALGLAMLLGGADPSRPTVEAAETGLARLATAAAKPSVQFTYDFADGLRDGSLGAAMAWSGDIVQLRRENPNIEFVIPDEGAVQWYDTMVVPRGSDSTTLANAFMNYVYEPVNAALITNWVQYISPVIGVRDALADLGADAAELAENEILFPDAQTRQRLFVWGSALDETTEDDIEARFFEFAG